MDWQRYDELVEELVSQGLPRSEAEILAELEVDKDREPA